MKFSETTLLEDNICPIHPAFVDLWREGCFDEYSENHFLIRAIKKDPLLEKELEQYRCNGFVSAFDPENFIQNLAMKICALMEIFSNEVEKIKDFVQNQMAAGKQNYREKSFFDAYSEILLLYYLGAMSDKKGRNFYEPSVNNMSSKNPEAIFNYPNGKKIAIEVKNAAFPSLPQNPKFIMPLYPMEKEKLDELDMICQKDGYCLVRPRVGKMKDFINSACEKFNKPLDDNSYNILAMNWTDTNIPNLSVIEPAVYLGNKENGMMQFNTMASKISSESFVINQDMYEKITAILVFKNSMDTLFFSDFRFMFRSKEAAIILNPFLLNTAKKQKDFLDTLQFHPFMADYNCYVSVPMPQTPLDGEVQMNYLNYVRENYIKP